jgi:hypothetical protein
MSTRQIFKDGRWRTISLQKIRMSAPNSGLPDLTIWDSIRDCATAALKNLVTAIELEISGDQTLADLRETGSVRVALEFRARSWMARAFACCLSCWETAQRKEETVEFRNAVSLYGLWPFFTQEVLTLLRLAAGVSQVTIDRLERGESLYPQRDQSAIHNASEVYTALMTTWPSALPAIKKHVVAEALTPTAIVTKAPKPPQTLSGTGGRVSPKPRSIMLPVEFPPSFPTTLALKARVILADVVKEFPDRSKLEDLCKELVTRYTDLLCSGVRSGILNAHAAPDELADIVKYVLVTNCERDTERYDIQEDIINSDAWHAMLRALLDCESNLGTEKREGVSTDESATRQRIDDFIQKLKDRGHSITRRDIWQVAGYNDPTEFERFQRDAPRTTPGSRSKFERILQLSPEAFLEKLDKLGRK